jgi:hypothetical protein
VLVAVLLLIALATVLIVTTSGVSQIERKAVSNSAKEQIAKQNALFALQVALAQLQSAAGPDQRVTATADILNSNSASPSPVSQPYWTGVWKTYNPSYTSSPWFRPEPLDVDVSGAAGTISTALRPWSTASTNVTWLVSGATNNTLVNPIAWTASGSSGVPAFANSTNSVILANNWGTNTSTTGNNTNTSQVLAPLVTLKNGTTNTGRYAYWVSDEGVKAKVNLVDTNMTIAAVNTPGMLVSSILHLTAPAAHNISSIMTNYGISTVLTTDFRSNTNLPKITSLAGLAFITNGVPAFTNNNLAADLTVWSYGVLCDVRRGGLKQDLTAAFEANSVNSTSFRTMQYRSGTQNGSITSNDSLMAYRASATAIPTTPTNYIALISNSIADGLRWQSIYNYYNLYKTSWPTSPIISSATGTDPSGVGTPSISGYNTIANRAPGWTDPAGSGMVFSQLTPSVICDALTVTLGSKNVSGTNFFTVSYYPLVVLYNPYATALNVGNSAYCMTKSLGGKNAFYLQALSNGVAGQTMGSNNAGTPADNLWPATLVTNAPVTYTNAVLQAAPGNYALTLGVTNPGGSVMLPGEIRVYGLPGANTFYTNNTLSNKALFEQSQMGLLRSSNNIAPSLTPPLYGGVSVVLNNTNNWSGSTNSSDTYSIAGLATYAVGYNTYHYTPQLNYNSGTYTISQWPNVNNSDLPGSLSGTGLGNFINPSTNGTITSLASYPQVVMSICERIKGTLSAANFTSQFPTYQTNLPIFLGNSIMLNAYRPADGLGGQSGLLNYSVETCSGLINSFISVVNNPNNGMATTSWLSVPVGDSASPNTTSTSANNTQLVLRDVPIAPMTSLGQLMHLEEYYCTLNQPTNNYNLFPVALPAMSIGGSFCSPETGPYFNTIYFNGNSTANQQWHLLMDHSLIANEALFDTYFFSTVPPTNGFSWGSANYGAFSQSISSNTISQRQALPNPRNVFYFKNGTNPAVSDLQDESKAAANLLIDGAFNVNSTSVAAWKALLTSLNGNTFGAYNYLTGSFNQSVSGVTNPIPRFLSVVRSAPNDPWEGMRSLTDQQVSSLAAEIVKQVRARGPFLSMGDFLNRRLAASSAGYSSTNLMGALQQAIENTQTNGAASDVNANVHVSTVSTSTAPWTISYNHNGSDIYPTTNSTTQIPVNAIVTNTATGIPGYLMQQDLIQAFAPVMTVRSDTFLIRVYGESDKPSTAAVTSSGIYSQAWGEAVVQRLPDYFDQTDTSLTTTLSSVNGSTIVPGIVTPLRDATPPRNSSGWVINSLNQTFGRRFKIVSFRWLNPNEL